MSTDYLPRTDLGFLTWITAFLQNLLPRLAKLGIAQSVYDSLKALADVFIEKMAVVDNPETLTKAATREKNEAREALEKQLRADVTEYLTNNHLLTNADRDILGLPIHKTGHTPTPVPLRHPDFDVYTNEIRHLKVSFYDQGSTSKAKPAGVHGAEVRWGISTTPPVDINELPNSSFDTASPLTLEFTESQRGSTVYFCLRWENTTGQKGPWSEIVKAIIP
jgi:hypothetical protein